MSAREFAQWQVMFRAEQLHPAATRLRHAQVLAATYQGQSTRKGGKGWAASDFMGSDPWALKGPSAPASPGGQARRMAALASRQRRH